MAEEYKRLTNEERLEEILHVLLSYTKMDFSQNLDISNEGDEIDAIAAGINMLGEELAYSINKERASRAQLIQYSSQLEARNKELEQFIYITSHDLQEPLRSATSLITIINDLYAPKFDDQGKEMMGFVLESVDRMSLLIKGLLNYLIIGSEIEKEDIDFNDLLKLSAQKLLPIIAESSASIKGDNLPVVKVYKEQISSLLDNLISNAIKFSKPKVAPRILISAKERKTEWLFSVKDNGIGIEEQYFERIFKIFQRLHNRAEFPGTGIGLAQCQKIVEMHGGKIWVESELEKGSTFYFTIKK